MFGLLKKKNPYEQDAYGVYEIIMKQVQNPDFYTIYGVPDTFDGRFEVLLAHTFMIAEILHSKDGARAEAFNQAVFDRIFIQMKITLREIGVGDVGIPKHMQKMMKAFNGRMHSYSDALKVDDLNDALIRNLYGTVDEPDLAEVQAFADYMQGKMVALQNSSFDEIIGSAYLFEGK